MGSHSQQNIIMVQHKSLKLQFHKLLLSLLQHRFLLDMGIDILAEYPMVTDLMGQYASNGSTVQTETEKLADAVIMNVEATEHDG